MIVNYVPKYYKLDIIPEYRQKFIDLKIRQLIKEYEIKKWPIDSLKLVKKIKAKGDIKLVIGFMPNAPKNFDARAKYHDDVDMYTLIINSDKYKNSYPFKCSKDRRLNFTLAHEIGHIILEHLIIPDNYKSPSEKEIEEEEANEFAGRLLMPKQKFLSCNFTDEKRVAEYFEVSEQAMWKRLNHLKRLDLIRNKTPLIVCETCYNQENSPFALYCKICGEPIDNPKGVETMIYDDGYELDSNGRVLICPRCGNEEMSPNGEYCRICGLYLINKCTSNFSCGTVAGNARYCEECGSITTFFQNNLLLPWEEAKTKIEQKQMAKNEVTTTLENKDNEQDNGQYENDNSQDDFSEDDFSELGKPINFSEDDLPF